MVTFHTVMTVNKIYIVVPSCDVMNNRELCKQLLLGVHAHIINLITQQSSDIDFAAGKPRQDPVLNKHTAKHNMYIYIYIYAAY